MTTRRERAISQAILAALATDADVPPAVAERAKALATRTPLDEERLRRAAEKRERKGRRGR